MVTLENTAYSLSQLDNISATAQAFVDFGSRGFNTKPDLLIQFVVCIWWALVINVNGGIWKRTKIFVEKKGVIESSSFFI